MNDVELAIKVADYVLARVTVLRDRADELLAQSKSSEFDRSGMSMIETQEVLIKMHKIAAELAAVKAESDALMSILDLINDEMQAEHKSADSLLRKMFG